MGRCEPPHRGLDGLETYDWVSATGSDERAAVTCERDEARCKTGCVEFLDDVDGQSGIDRAKHITLLEIAKQDGVGRSYRRC